MRVKVHKDSSASFPYLKRSTGIEPRATPPRKFGTRATPTKFVLYIPKNIVPNLVLVRDLSGLFR